MLKQTMRRNNGVDNDLGTMDVTPRQAFRSLVVYELGFGGTVTSITRTRLQVSTRVLGCHDVTIWEGPEAEMRPLIEIAAAWAQVKKVHGDRILSDAEDFLMEVTDGSPLLLTMAGGPEIGGRLMKTALILGMCSTPEDLETCKPYFKHKMEELCEVASLVVVDKQPLEEALSLLDS